ncbi:stalk domain-containing protein [Paenibacillus sp. GCM10027627]|uniref:stalk domain-containing protein n=1 Tax=unclassified Paenibacillus TaxID=185978 RepID=UPI00363A0A07
MQMKKSVFVASLLTCSLVFGAVGAVASTGVEKISASLNHNIKFILDGKSWKPKDSSGKELSALVYKGSTYVPLRAVGNALGAEVDYDADKMQITIDSSGDNGIPHKDDTDNGSNNGGGSNDNDDDDSNVPSGSGVLTLPSNFNMSQTTEDLKKHAVSLIKIYGAALEDEDYSEFNKYVKKYVSPKVEGTYLMGHEFSIKEFEENIQGSIDANDSETIQSYGKDLQKVKAEGLVIQDTDKDEYGATISFEFTPEGWEFSSTINVYLNFEKLKNGTYVLDSVYFV